MASVIAAGQMHFCAEDVVDGNLSGSPSDDDSVETVATKSVRNSNVVEHPAEENRQQQTTSSFMMDNSIIEDFSCYDNRKKFVDRLQSRRQDLAVKIVLFESKAVELILHHDSTTDVTTFDRQQLSTELGLSSTTELSISRLLESSPLKLSTLHPGEYVNGQIANDVRTMNCSIAVFLTKSTVRQSSLNTATVNLSHLSKVTVQAKHKGSSIDTHSIFCQTDGREPIFYLLTTGHGMETGMSVHGQIGDNSVDIGSVERVWRQNDPVCDAALIRITGDIGALTNSLTEGSDTTNETVHLKPNPAEPVKEDVVYKYRRGLVSSRDERGRIHNSSYWHLDDPRFSDGVVVVKFSSENDQFTREGDSGMLLVKHTKQHDLKKGVAIITGYQWIQTQSSPDDVRERKLTIAQPFGRTLDIIRQCEEYRDLTILQ